MAKQIPHDLEQQAPTPRSIYERLDQYVIGQERAKRTLSIAAYHHHQRIRRIGEAGAESDLLRKSNVLLIGPSGCGKTHLARNLSRVLDLPFSVVDATEYTEAGYYGKDVEVMLGELLYAAELDVDRAQQGIIFIDEVDKIARRNQGERTGAGQRDIGGEGVQQSLLKLLEGTTCFVPYNLTQHWNKHDFVQMDTTNILFILAGTFTDLKRGRSLRVSGFKRDEPAAGSLPPLEDRVTVEDLLEYGMIAEFMGRVPVIVELAELSEDDLVKIITEPPDSIYREYRSRLALDGVDLTLSPEALREIARQARRRKLGARALRSMFEDLMHDFMFEAPDHRGQKLEIGLGDVRTKLR